MSAWRSYHYWGCVEVDHGVCCSSSAALLVLGSRGTLGRGCSLWQASAGCFPWYGSTRPPTHPPARTRMSSSPDPAQGCSSELFRWRFVLIGRRRLNLESWRCSGVLDPDSGMAGLVWPWRWRRMPVSVWLLVLSNPYFDVRWYS